MTRFLGILVVLAVAVVWAGCQKKPAGVGSSGHATPEAAFQSLKQATDKQDWRAAAQNLVPESQVPLAFALVMKTSFSTFGDAAKEKSLNELLTRHGLNLDDDAEVGGEDDLDQHLQEMFKSVSNIPALIGDLGDWSKLHAADGANDKFLQLGALSDVKTEGDKATGSVATEGGPMPIEFRKSASGWLVHLPN
ncbi:MAG TPA: hypothetical protein PKD54_01880 [Pirellulaceae bacterium]|nr:hypothetical protein [Pirellulaceae bacterium]